MPDSRCADYGLFTSKLSFPILISAHFFSSLHYHLPSNPHPSKPPSRAEMDPAFRKIHRDIIRLHEEEEKIKSLSAARELGIKIRRIDRTFPSSSSLGNFKPTFFIPPKGDKLSTYHRCAKCASCAAPSSPSSSLSTLPNRLSLSHSFSAWPSSRRFSSSSTRSSPACEAEAEAEQENPEIEEQEPVDCEHGEIYPYMIRSLAEMQEIEPPALPKAARQPVLTANG